MKFNDQRQENQKQRGNIHPMLPTARWQITQMYTNQSYFLIAAFTQEPKWGLNFILPLEKNNEITFIDTEKGFKLQTTSRVHRDGTESEDVKTPATLVVLKKTALLSDQRVLACGLHQGHPSLGPQAETLWFDDKVVLCSFISSSADCWVLSPT